MAFWNAPLDDASHEKDACEEALAMLAAVDALNQEREASISGGDFTPIAMGIGINTGRCTVGNIDQAVRGVFTAETK